MDRDKENRGWRSKVKSLWSRVPLASIVAFSMCVVGILVFCICLYLSMEYIISVFNLTIIGKVVWLLMFLHLIVCVCLLVLGTLSSGKTREEVYEKAYQKCKRVDFLGKGAHIAAIATSYFWHFFWLLMPAILILPVALVTGVSVGCQYIPDCITLSDLGIPVSVTQKIISEEWVNYARNYNISSWGQYIDQGESAAYDLLDKVEDSGMIDKVVETVDRIIPNKTTIDRLKARFAERVEAVSVEKYLVIIEETVNKTMDIVIKESSKIGDLADKIGNWDLGNYLGNGTISGMLESINVSNLVDTVMDGNAIKTAGEIRERVIGILNDTNFFTPDEITVFADNFGGILMDNIPGFDSSDPNKTLAVDGVTRAKAIEAAGQTLEGEIVKKAKERLESINETNPKAADEINLITRMSIRGVGRIERLAEGLATAVLDQWVKTSGQVTDDVIKKLTENAEEAVQQAQAAADKAAAKSAEAANKAKEAEDEILKQVDEDAKKAAEEAAELANRIADKAKEIAENAKRKAQEAQDMAREMANAVTAANKELVVQSAAKLHQLGRSVDKDVETGLKELEDQTMRFISSISAEAETISQNAEEAVKKAVEVATDMVEKAEKASKDALNKLDDIARDLARKSEEKVKQAAKLVKKYTRLALIKVRQAITWLKRSLIKLADKAGDFALKLSSRIRQYASEAIVWARKATHEVAHYARLGLGFATIGQSKAMETYDLAKSYVMRLEITQEGEDTFCSETKRMICRELKKASTCLILVFIAALVLNLGFLHWLMALAVNYIHIRQETRNLRKEDEGNSYRRSNISESGKSRPFKQSESGSMHLLSRA